MLRHVLLTLPALWLVLMLVFLIPAGVLAIHRKGRVADRAIGVLSFVRLR